MAKKAKNSSRPQNVLAKENTINRKITEGILPTLPSFVADYDRFLDTEGRSVKTRLAYARDIAQFLEYMIADTGLSNAITTKDIALSDIERLKSRDVNDYLAYIKEYQAEDGSVIQNGPDARARKKSSICGLLKFLYRQDMIEYDITGKVLSVSVKQSSRAVRALQENESIDLLEVVFTGKGLTERQLQYWKHTKYRDAMILALFTIAGLRLSELQQLNVSSFNLKREEFVVYRKRGKESIMPLNSTLIRLFNEYMENDRGHCTDIAAGHTDALFLGSHTEEKSESGKVHHGRKRLSERQISDIVHKYTAIVTGEPNGYSPHKLRATAATTAIQRGVDMSRVAALLDHDNVSTTQRYINVTQDDKRKAIEKMEY